MLKYHILLTISQARDLQRFGCGDFCKLQVKKLHTKVSPVDDQQRNTTSKRSTTLIGNITIIWKNGNGSITL